MTRIFTAFSAAAVTIGIIGSAFAADMTEDELKAFVSGSTVWLQTTAASASSTAGEGQIYWAEDGTALYKTPTGATWHGTWTIKGNQLCADWKERPSNACVKYAKDGDLMTVHAADSGELRATIVEQTHGNVLHIEP